MASSQSAAQPAVASSSSSSPYLSSSASVASSSTASIKSNDPKKLHITDHPITKSNWYKHVNWLNVVFIILIPLYGCVSAYSTPLRVPTAIFAVLYYFMTGLGITAGKFEYKHREERNLGRR
jgi:stearoyl-CoA desaturase (delta-9 desaturase)